MSGCNIKEFYGISIWPPPHHLDSPFSSRPWTACCRIVAHESTGTSEKTWFPRVIKYLSIKITPFLKQDYQNCQLTLNYCLSRANKKKIMETYLLWGLTCLLLNMCMIYRFGFVREYDDSSNMLYLNGTEYVVINERSRIKLKRCNDN